MPEEMITISKEFYDELVDNSNKLIYLEAGGVDNWEGYDFSLEEYYEEKE